MLDIQTLRNDLAATAVRLATRGYTLDTAKFEQLEAERKTIQTRTQELQAKRNASSKLIGQAKAKGEDVSAIMAEVGALGEELKQLEAKLPQLLQEVDAFLAVIPNMPHATRAGWQVGSGQRRSAQGRRSAQVCIRSEGSRQHRRRLGGLDFETATKIAGARFSLLKGPLARLHRALAQFMLDTHTEKHGYTETYVPYMVNAESMRGTGQLPKFEEDLFQHMLVEKVIEMRMYSGAEECKIRI